jgi:hypothetical protein
MSTRQDLKLATSLTYPSIHAILHRQSGQNLDRCTRSDKVPSFETHRDALEADGG